MSGETPRRTLRISDDEWTQIQADAEAAGRNATEHLLDCWRLARDPSRKLPRLYVAAQLATVRSALEAALKTLDKTVR